MTWLGGFNPTPSFPAYTGRYKVGSVDVEIPASDLNSPSPAPENAPATVAFRIFYPCQDDSKQSAVRWLPSPQREYISAYARFLGANSAFSYIFSVIPQLLYYTSIPVHNNATILEPTTTSKRWPVMIFSHGLGGSRNAYSQIVGSIASHGIVVVAPDHRDGSSPISFVRSTEDKKLQRVEYKKLPHNASTEVYEGRDAQLRIRLWELGLVYDALLKIDRGETIRNLAKEKSSRKGDSANILSMFSRLLEVQEPGSVALAGHSFGAASMVQLVKSTFYHASNSPDPNYRPLFTPSRSSAITRQITPFTPLILLDLWALPIQSPATAWLHDRPLPGYTTSQGGSNVLAILSEAFYKWSSNFQETKRTISGTPESRRQFPQQSGPHLFYPISSAHLSQSDFGVLFPWVTTKVFGAKEPERVLRLNVRAILQVLRNNGIEVADTSDIDMEVGELQSGVITTDKAQDMKILSSTKDAVRGWVSLSADSSNLDATSPKVGAVPSDAVIESEVIGEVFQDSQRRTKV